MTFTARVSSLARCKRFYSLASSKSAWINIVQDLRNRGFIDRRLARDPGQLTTSQLVTLVRRVISGPPSWSPTPDTHIFTPSILGCTLLNPAPEPAGEYRALYPVPGGDYVFVVYSTVLECYAVEDGRKIWTSEPLPAAHQISHVVIDRHQEEVSILLQLRSTTDGNDCAFFQLVSLDLRKHRAIQLLWLQIDALGQNGWNLQAEAVHLNRDIFAFRITGRHTPDCCLALVDWRKLTIGVVSLHNSPCEAIAGTVLAVLTKHDDNDSFVTRLSIYDLRVVYALLPVVRTQADEPVLWNTLRPLELGNLAPSLSLGFDVPRAGSGACFPALSIFPSPLEDGAYRLWLSTGTTPDRNNTFSTSASASNQPVHTLHLISLSFPNPATGPGSIRLRKSYPTERWRTAHGVTFSGHTLQLAYPDTLGKRVLTHANGLHHTVDLTASDWLGKFEPEGAGGIWMSPYSGDWVCNFDDKVAIVHFR
ncbi:F-box domain-containing protein [Mycena kentingensis (nom. inval.)]|nr:F-box domain-containing protein [Mycena kentingensis (nom. inval.)]